MLEIGVELESLCDKILELKGVVTAFFFDVDGEIRAWKTKVEKNIISKAETEKAITNAQMVKELVCVFNERVGPLELVSLHYKLRNVFIIPLNGICLIFSTEKVPQDNLIKRVQKIIEPLTASFL